MIYMGSKLVMDHPKWQQEPFSQALLRGDYATSRAPLASTRSVLPLPLAGTTRIIARFHLHTLFSVSKGTPSSFLVTSVRIG